MGKQLNWHRVAVAPGLTRDEYRLLDAPLPHSLAPDDEAVQWNHNLAVLDRLMIRMGKEHPKAVVISRLIRIRSRQDLRSSAAVIPTVQSSAQYLLARHGLQDMQYRLAGELVLMELSAAAGYRTFCFPELVRGLNRTGKMQYQPVQRMIDTFEFLKTMFERPLDDAEVRRHFARTNRAHGHNRVASAGDQAARDLFKYIALNMFYIGPMMRPDLSPAERHAICSQTVLVSGKMGHCIEGSTLELEQFIADYEAAEMFDLNDHGELRRSAIDIARASKLALGQISLISPATIHSYVPYGVKRILGILGD